MIARSSIPADVDWVEGSLLMVSINAIETVGSLDPRFFAFWEEAEFCRRVRFSEKRIVIALNAGTRHYGGMLFLKESNRALRHWPLSRNYPIYKPADPGRSFVHTLLGSVRLFVTNMKSELKKSPGAALLELRAYVAVWMRIHGWYKKWSDDCRHIKPVPLGNKYGGIQPEILFSASRKAAIAK
jgi:GT2 family glycosyltransferase